MSVIARSRSPSTSERCRNPSSTARRSAPTRSSALHHPELRGQVPLDGLELARDGGERALEGEAGLEPHHREVQRVGERRPHPLRAARLAHAKRVLGDDAAHDEARERRERDEEAVGSPSAVPAA